METKPSCGCEATPLRWTRVVLSLVAIPLIVVSCATVPQAGTGPSASRDRSPDPSAHAGQPAIQPTPADPRAYYHFLLGYRAEQAQDADLAIREYLLALRGDPTSIFLKTRLAALYFSLGDIAAAVRFADRVAEAEVREVTTLVLIAGIYAGAGEADKALALYDRAIAQNPEHNESYFSKGVLLVNLKRLEEAEQVFQQGIDKAKDSPVGHYYLGRIAVEAKQFDRAAASFERAISTNPTFEPAYIALAGVYESQRQREQAVAVYRKYLQVVNPHSKEVQQHIVRLYLNDKLYREALAELNDMLNRDPDDLDAQLRIGLIYGEIKDYPKAIAQLTKILAVRPAELKVRDYLALMYEEQKDYGNAIKAYEQNLRLQPAYVDGHMHLGFLQYRLKHYPDAIAHFTDAVKLNPKQPEGHLLLGLAHLQAEQFALATQAFEEGIRLNPGNPDLHFNLGTAYDKLNRFDEVVKAMETALRLDPQHADALNYLGYSYTERGIKIEEAVSLIQRAVILKPNNGYYVDSLGWAFFKMGRLDEALAEMKRAASLVKDDPVIFEHLGEVYLQQNLVPEAREAWLHSLELDPANLKLMERFRERGMGDPTSEERIRQAKQRVSQHASPQAPTP
ncbi:MAG: tetratricopeptide repeat protein [Nitrospirae bacterium]|nr:MAG: tetratricopeptide repeat protein [Nitrospirota bacterium]